MPVSYNTMLRATPQNIRKNSLIAQKGVRKKGSPRKYAKLGDVYEIVYKVKCTSDWRTVTFRFLKKNPKDPIPVPNLNGPVWVRCSCPWFLFNCEYALTKQGSSWIHYSNGQPSSETNPTNSPWVCKHIYAMKSEIQNFKQDPVREPKKKVLGPMYTPPGEVPQAPNLTPQQELVKDQTLDALDDLNDKIEDSSAPKGVTKKIRDTVTDIIDRITKSDSPVAKSVKDTLVKVVEDVADAGAEALTDLRIKRKLDDLIKRFRGY